MTALLTKRQKQVLNAIEKAISSNNRPPSIPELMESLGVASPNGIAKHLKALEAKGYIAREPGARGIRLLKKVSDSEMIHIADHISAQTQRHHDDVAYLPLIGQIAAGSPILADEHVEEIIPVPESMSDAGEVFFLRVKGESMIEEGIMPGDLVMVSRCDSVVNGELAAVMVDDEATVKRFYKEKGQIILQPANPVYEPIVVVEGSAECKVIGKVIGLLRSYKRRF